MDTNYVSKALCFHGPPLQKIWEDERGTDDLHKLRINQPNFTIYQERQKFFTFQERAKRLRLHQFLSRKADDLYDKTFVGNVMLEEVVAQAHEHLAQLPPYEYFMQNIKDRSKCWQHRLNELKPGDVIYAAIIKTLAIGTNRVFVKPLCTAQPKVRYLADIPVKAYVLQEFLGPLPLDKQGNPRSYNHTDYVCCEVFEVSADAERMTLGMTGVLTKSKLKLGLVDIKDFPSYYRTMSNLENENYEEILKATAEFENPNLDMLYQINGLNINDNFSLMSNLKYDFPAEDYASELRAAQANTWAFHYVAEGIDRFKNGQQIEAFQCLNKALNIDPRNVEGLVARGALYANKGSFLKAIDDFEKALALNSYHVNARKYMGETLVALGQSYEEEQRFKEAAKAYSDCLNIIPNHEQARMSLEALQRPNNTMQNAFQDLLQLPVKESSSFRNRTYSENSHIINISSNGSDDNDSNQSLDQLKQYTDNISPRQSMSQPFYAINLEKKVLSSSKNVNEFKLDDDETVNQVQKLIDEANRHQKEKRRSEKDRKNKKRNKKDGNESNPLQKSDFQQANKPINNYENNMYNNNHLSDFSNIGHLESDTQTMSYRHAESPPPVPPPVLTFDDMAPSTSRRANSNHNNYSIIKKTPPPPKINSEQQKLSFQIKRPVKIDKFGLIRVATPLSYNRSRSRSRSRSLTRQEQRRSTRREYSSSRSRSRSRGRRGRRHSRSKSRTPVRHRNYLQRRERPVSPYRRRSRTPERFRRSSNQNQRRATPNFLYDKSPPRRRRAPSPFVPRGTPSPRSRYRRSSSQDFDIRNNKRSNRSRSSRRSYRFANSGYGGGYSNHGKSTFGGRIWPRRNNHGAPCNSSRGSSYNDDHNESDAEQANHSSRYLNQRNSKTIDDPTIEEIDEIIDKAQRERKQEIIKRDKDLLKK